MIVNCPACQGASRAQGDGLYRCPHCRAVFRVDGAQVTLTEAPPPAAPTAPTPPAAPASAAAPPTPDAGPAPPVCERCGYWQATAVCPVCGKMVCTVCALPADAGQAVCRAHGTEQAAGSPENGFWEMLTGVLSRPVETFSAVLPDARLLGRSVLFFIVLGMAGMVFTEVYRAALPPPYNDPTGALLAQFTGGPPAESSALALIAAAMIGPFALLFSLFGEGLILHAALRMVGSGRSGIAATVKVVAYAGASLALLALPVIGAPLGWALNTILTVIGAARVHRSGYGRAAAAMLLIVFLVAVLVAAAYGLLQYAGGVEEIRGTSI